MTLEVEERLEEEKECRRISSLRGQHGEISCGPCSRNKVGKKGYDSTQKARQR